METEIAVAATATTATARAAQSEASQMLSQVMTVILDPNVPDSRIDRLLALQAQLIADQRRMMFVEAKSRLSPLLPTIDRSGKMIIYSKADRAKAELSGQMSPEAVPIQKTSYAKQEDIIEAIRPLIGEYGFDLNFEPSRTTEGRIGLRASLSHVGGHVQTIDVPNVEVDASGNKNNIQGLGSSLKYLMRYGTLLLLNIVSRDPRDGLDNDGANGAPLEGVAKITGAQHQQLAAEIKSQGGSTLADVLNAYEIGDPLIPRYEDLAGLPASKFDSVVKRLAERRKRAAAAGKNSETR